jgi:RNA polymerase sigma-70 factor (ECF subfamily)
MTRAHVDATTQSQAFEAMVSPHFTALSALAWHLTRDPVHTEDLVQETLLKAYRFLHRFELGTNFRAWLMTMMRHLYFSQLRKQAREVLTEHLEYIPAAAPSELEADADTDRLTTLNDALPHVVSDEVYNALQEVPETYRTAVLLADVLDYSYKEMADIMECPIGTVMSRLYRGRQKLQARLQPYAMSQGYIRHEDDDTLSLLATDAEEADDDTYTEA